MREFNDEQKAHISADSKGKVIESCEWSPADKSGPGYWVMTFTDGTEICFRFMAELV